MTGQSSERVNLRPTLILALGGSGGRIALELKARLEEQFGQMSGYHKAIKFLYFDTANENFLAFQPNHPDRPAVRFESEREFVRISDVPLYDLMQSKDTNPAIAAILPEVLYTTQIDQGAQQVRRLGRIALFYHYGRVKEKLKHAINSLRQLESVNRLEDSSYDREIRLTDRNRLRVFVLGSLCGGTGSGIFLDMAYMVRHLAVESGLASARAVDVIGMLMLPEAFPEIVTTGAARIRANAYGALLDLEYFNQPAAAHQALYQVDFPGEQIRVPGAPFSLCYLVSSSGKEGTVQGMVDLAPILAEALFTKIATRIGEQLDATLDNIRASLHNYHRGYRAFYSALGGSQIIYPHEWLKRQFSGHLQDKLIHEVILKKPGNGPNREETSRWFETLTSEINAALETDLPILNRDRVVQALNNLVSNPGNQEDVIASVELAYRDSMRSFQSRVLAQVQLNYPAAKEIALRHLRDAITKNIDEGLTDPEHGGIVWCQQWLDSIEQYINEAFNQSPRFNLGDAEKRLTDELIQLARSQENWLWSVRQQQTVKAACRRLIDYIRIELWESLIHTYRLDVLTEVLREISNAKGQINLSLGFWRKLTLGSKAQLPPPQLPPLTQSALDSQTAQDEITATINSRLMPEQLGGFLSAFKVEIGNLSRSLDPGEHAALSRDLERFCSKQSQINQMNIIEALQRMDENLRKDMLAALGTQAEPLLAYSDGLLQASPPRRIEVLGIQDIQGQGESIRRDIGRMNDVSTVSTGDPNRVGFLITHHGIPVQALSKFDDYRRQYHKLSEDRNALFHINNELEFNPHDPGSKLFANPDSLDGYFARAIAYRWIIAITKTKPGQREIRETVFVLEQHFFETYLRPELIQAKKEAQQQQANRQHNPSDNGGRASASSQNSLKERELKNIIEAIDRHLAYFSDKHKTEGQDERSGRVSGYAIPVRLSVGTEGSGDFQGYAMNLASSREAILNDPTRTLPLYFQYAFEKAYPREGGRNLDREYLKDIDALGNSPEFTVSAQGQAGHEVAQQILDHLCNYVRLHQRKESEERRPVDAYYQ
jgi:hypothetical protein